MPKQDPMPNDDEKKKRRKPRYIIDPKDVPLNDQERVRNWASEIMHKNEYKLNNKWRDRQIVTSGEIEPERIDIKAIYPFPDLHWIIYKNNSFWSFMVLSKHRMIFNIDYAQI